MSDLSTIFKQSKQDYSYTVGRSYLTEDSVRNTADRYRSYQANPATSPNPTPATPKPKSSLIVNEAKRVITYSDMQEEVDWFHRQFTKQAIIKIIIIGALTLLSYLSSLLTFSTSLSAFVLAFFLFGLKHNNFNGVIIEKWAYCSMIGSLFVLCNQIFLFFVRAINEESAAFLSRSYLSLIPTLHTTIILMMLYNSSPLIYSPISQGFIENLLSFFSHLRNAYHKIFQMSYAILTIEVWLIIATIIGFYVEYKDSDDIDQFTIHRDLFNIYVLIAQLLTFFVIVAYVIFLYQIISQSVSHAVVSVFYQQKNSFTKIPSILELLRVKPNEQAAANPKITISQIFSIKDRRKYVLTRVKAETIYRQSIRWILDLVNWNEEALNTKITTSRFYHNYWDIFREFSEDYLQKSAIRLIELEQMIKAQDHMVTQKKTMAQDLFIWARVLKVKYEVWCKSVECCEYLQLVDNICQIICVVKDETDLKNSIGIANSLQQINDKEKQFKLDKYLDVVIRDRMHEQYNKSLRVLQALGRR